MVKKYYFLLVGVFLIIQGVGAQAVTYIVNSNNDVDDGTCNAAHCSLREAIKASEADGKRSIINFNIPGPSPQTIVPSGVLPVINADSTEIGIPNSNPNKVVIDFSFRDIGGATFFQINGNQTKIYGLDFVKMLYNNNNDHIISIGTGVKAANEVNINNCAFFQDNSTMPNINRKAIEINQGDKVVIDSNYFGTDRISSQIYSTNGSILIQNTQASNTFNINNNIFVTKVDGVEAHGGDGLISKNIFGAYDTTKSLNFLDPDYAILLSEGNKYTVDNNFFFGQTKNSILINNLMALTEIRRNRFHLTNQTIAHTGNSAATIGIINNYARNGKGGFVSSSMTGSYSLNIDGNDVSIYDVFYGNTLDPAINLAGYSNNRITCISGVVTFLDNTNSPKPNTPTVVSVNRNQILGTSDPNMFVAVYANPNTGCPNTPTVCQGGILLGTTQANALGSWVLNVNYPNKNTISAYQYKLGTGYNIFSEFSPCYTCTNNFKETFSPTICATSNVTYRGKNYSASNPYDSIVVPGDGVSICDSVFVVKLNVKNATREFRAVNYCYNQSISICGVTIDKNKSVDSCKLLNSAGCDSIIVFTGTERGYSQLSQTICSNSNLNVLGEIFDANRTSGTVVKPGGSFGCDTVIDVNITVKNYAETNISQLLCPGEFIQVGPKRFDINNPKGSNTFVNGSATGCDSIVNVDLSFINAVSFQNYSICENDSISIPGTGRFISTRKLNDTLYVPKGAGVRCDSTIFIKVTPMLSAIGIYRQEICRTDTLRLGQKQEIFHAGRLSGSFVDNNTAANGCDSITQVVLTVLPDAIGRLDTIACEGEIITLYNKQFTQASPSGNLKTTLKSYRGCDTFAMVNVTFIPKKTGFANPVICRNGSIQIGGTVFSASNPTGQVVINRTATQGCDSTVNVNVTIAPSIIPTYVKEDLLCNEPNSGSLTIQSISAGAGNLLITIDNKNAVNFTPGQLFSGLGEGLHNIKITDAFGCDTTITINIDRSQTLSLTLPNDTLISQGASITINSQQNFVPRKITWDPPTYLSCSDCLNPKATPDQDTKYTLTLEDEFGCEIKEDILIRVKIDEADIYMPNVFSPYNDSNNDIVYPEFRFPSRTKINIFRVFDRWGALVFERLNGGIGEKIAWNGIYNGRTLNPGVYTYAIQYESLNQEAKQKTAYEILS